jgi:hypothetical protein
MKTISLSVSEADYEVFRRAAAAADRSIAQLIREAMALYRAERLEERAPLRDLPVLVGHKPLTLLPTRAQVYEEVFTDKVNRNS